MGQYDYQKSYSGQMESIVISICALYALTELFWGYCNARNPWGQVAVLASMLLSYSGILYYYIFVNNAICGISEIMLKDDVPNEMKEDVPNKTEINAAVYINMEQFAYTALRDEYSRNIKHIVEQSEIRARAFHNLSELKRWVKRENYNQVFIGFAEYQEDPVFFDNLSMQTKVNIPINKQKTMQDYVQPQNKEERELIIGDLDIAKGFTYCGNQKNYIEILRRHRDGGEENMSQVQELFDKGDWKNYIIVVHGIKSSMMSIGAVCLSEQARALELAGKGGNFDYIRKEHDRMMAEYHRVIDMLNSSPILGVKEVEEEACEKAQMEEEVFVSMLKDMENAVYELNDVKMRRILDKLSEYSYGGKDLQKILKPVYKKVEMSDLMSAYENVVKIKDKIKKA